VLKGKIKNSLRGILLRKSLVIFQFMASVALIAGTLIVYRQLNFMMNQNIGMDINQVLVIERPGISVRNSFNSSVDVFRNELKRDASIVGVSSSATIPGKQREYKESVKRYGASDDQLVVIRFNSMDYDFLNVFKMDLLAGRAFSERYTKDPDTSLVITASASRLLGFSKPEDALGQTLDFPEGNWRAIVVGIVNDYHQESMKKTMDPMAFYCSPYYGEFYSLRIQTSDLNHTLAHVKQCWEKAFPGNPFDYFFLDDYFNKQYENERRFGKLFTTFAALAVMVGCLGLFGLSAYTTTQRTKEIGVRKVLGSSERGIFYLLSQEYLKLVGISVFLATPLVWWVMDRWMQSFPYRTSINAVIFLIAGALVLFISLITVSYQTLKAARANPVDALRQD
jgi:putative ABC transport system permease protein